MACKGNENCPCTYTSCNKRGNCCKCVEYHKGKDEIPACFFSEEAEKTYDRSIEKLYDDYMSR